MEDLGFISGLGENDEKKSTGASDFNFSSYSAAKTDILDDAESRDIIIDEIEKVDGDILDNEDNYPDDVVFKTSQVASFLGLSAQTLRNYVAQFQDILDIQKADTKNEKYNYAQFRKKDVKDLRKILEVKEKNGWTVNETIKKLTNPTTAVAYASVDEKAMQNLIETLTKAVSESVDAKLSVFFDGINNRLAALPTPEEMEKNQIKPIDQEALMNDIKGEIEKIAKANEANLTNTEDAYQKRVLELQEEANKNSKAQADVNEKLLEQLNKMNERLEQQDKKIAELTEENRKQSEQIIEQTKKKSFFRRRKDKQN